MVQLRNALHTIIGHQQIDHGKAPILHTTPRSPLLTQTLQVLSWHATCSAKCSGQCKGRRAAHEDDVGEEKDHVEPKDGHLQHTKTSGAVGLGF